MSETHLKFAGQPEAVQRHALEAIVRGEPVLMEALRVLRDMALSDHYIASGAIYNTVWNALTGKPPLTGIKDIDVIYFDDSDLSYEAEDRVIKAVEARLRQLPVPVETRNQARVHLWFPERFGFVVPPLSSSKDSLLRYASRTHAVAVRLEPDDTLTIDAPFGLDDFFALRVTPNLAWNNRATHYEKAERAKSIWPEIEIIAWVV
jgi:uncharacterized protein